MMYTITLTVHDNETLKEALYFAMDCATEEEFKSGIQGLISKCYPPAMAEPQPATGEPNEIDTAD